MVQREGGTTLTEAAVARGLRWLARHQNADGSWSLDRFQHGDGCDCGDRGQSGERECRHGAGPVAVPGCRPDAPGRDLPGGSGPGPALVTAEPGRGRRSARQPRPVPGHVRARSGGHRAVRSVPDDGRRSAARPGSESDRLHRGGSISRRRLAVLSAARDAELAGRHECRGLAADGPAECPGRRPVSARVHAGKRRPLPRHGAARRGGQVLVSAARTAQCPDDGRSATVPHLPGLETQAPAVGRLRALDARHRNHRRQLARTSTTGTTLRRRSTILAAPNGTPGICRCATCWSPRRKPTGTPLAVGRSPDRSPRRAAAST